MIRELTKGTSGENECAGPDEFFFAHHVDGALISRVSSDFVHFCQDPEHPLSHPTHSNQSHVYEVRPRKDKRGVNLISDALPYGGLWNAGPNAAANAIGYGQFCSGSHHAVIRAFDAAGTVIETHKHKGEFREP